MAERLKEKLVESDKMVDLVVGPDAYRDLPRLVSQGNSINSFIFQHLIFKYLVQETGESAVNVLLSLDETYADITPVRTSPNGVSAYV